MMILNLTRKSLRVRMHFPNSRKLIKQVSKIMTCLLSKSQCGSKIIHKFFWPRKEKIRSRTSSIWLQKIFIHLTKKESLAKLIYETTFYYHWSQKDLLEKSVLQDILLKRLATCMLAEFEIFNWNMHSKNHFRWLIKTLRLFFEFGHATLSENREIWWSIKIS